MLDYRTYNNERLGKATAPRRRADITFREIRLDHLDEDAEIGRQIFNDGWKENWGFTPASEADIRALLHKFRPFLFKDSGFFVDVRGEPAAFILTIPNVFDISADLGASPSPIGWAKFGWRYGGSATAAIVWRSSESTPSFAIACSAHGLPRRRSRSCGGA